VTAPHRLVATQLAKATRPSGDVDHKLLCELMSTCYEELERDRKRVDRANKLMQEELVELTGDLERMVDDTRVQNLHFQAALDNMSQGLCLLDAEGRLTVANRRFLQIYGLTDELGTPGRPIAEILGASAVLQFSEGYLALSSAPRTGTMHQRLNDGRILLIAHEPLERGGCVDTFEDITERERANARLVLATEGGNIGLWDTQLSGGQTWFSDQFWTMLGYQPDEVPATLDAANELVQPGRPATPIRGAAGPTEG
jgi:PAS domain S-box-containing protein